MAVTMATVTNVCLVTFMLTYLNCVQVSGLSCAMCTPADPACRSGNILPTPCSAGERYCYILYVYVDRAQGTYRGCSGTDSVQGCIPVTVRQTQGTSCMSVCGWEGCNSSHGNTQSFLDRKR